MANGLSDGGSPIQSLGPVDVVDEDEALTQLRDSYSEWQTSTQTDRDTSALCRDYYDGEQWTDDEKATLRSRGQPVVVFNRIAKKVNYLTGSEIRTRSDPRTLPRTPMHEAAAEAMSDAIRYVSDEQQIQQTLTQVFEEFLVEGCGGVIVDHEAEDVVTPLGAEVKRIGEGVQVDAAEARKQEIRIRVRQVHHDRMWWDPKSREPDFSDAKYLGTVIWMDEDDLRTTYQGKGLSDEELDAIIQASRPDSDVADEHHKDRPSSWYDVSRDRYLVVEGYWRSDGQWYCGHAVGGGWVWPPRRSVYHDRKNKAVCPLIFGSAFCDRQNGRYGIVKGMLSAQDEINKRRSKALHAINVRQVVAEEGVVTDKRGFQNELAKPDGYAEVSPGSLMEGRIVFPPGGDLSAPQFQLLQEAKNEIDTVGPDSPMMGGQTNNSGRAILAWQQIASTELEKLFDHFRRLKRSTLVQVVLRVCQFWTQEKWIRVRDDVNDAGYRFIALNRPMTRGRRVMEAMKRGLPPRDSLDAAEVPGATELFDQAVSSLAAQMQAAGQQVPPEAIEKIAIQQLLQHPLAQEVVTDNDISQLDVDIIIDEAPDTAVVQQEEFDALAGMAQSGVPIPPEVLIEASQLRSKRKLLNMLKGQKDAAAQAAQQAQQEAQQLAIAQAQANVGKTKADTMASAAKAQKDQASAQAMAPKAAHDAALAQKTSLENQADQVAMNADQYRALMASRQMDAAAGEIGGPGPSVV